MSHNPRRTAAALAFSLALSLVPAFAQARPFTAMSGATPRGVEIRFADWVRSVFGSILDLNGTTAPAKNGSQLDPNGAPPENGPRLDPDGTTTPGENGSQLDPDGRT